MGSLSAALTDYRWPFDLAIYRALNGLPRPATWLSHLLGERLFGALCIAIVFGLILWRYRQRAFWPLLTAAVAFGATDLVGARVLKPLFHRLRPCYALPPDTLHVWSAAANTGSLPSQHAANAFALAWLLSTFVPRTALPAYTVASLIALSRVVAGVHWPSDVIAGAALGTAVGMLATWAARRFLPGKT